MSVGNATIQSAAQSAVAPALGGGAADAGRSKRAARATPNAEPSTNNGASTFSSLKTAEIVAREILQAICAGELQKGDPLTLETTMMTQYQAGRASVREGLRLLETQGLVTLKPGRSGGAFVGDANGDHLGRTLTLFLQMIGARYDDVAECNLVFGPKVAELAALNPDRKRVEQMITRALRTDCCHFTLSPETVPEKLLDFHRTINALCGNPVLGLLMDTVESIVVNHIIHLTPQEDRLPWFHADHQDVAKAIIAGDASRARDLQTEHLRKVMTFYRTRNHGRFAAKVQWR